MNPIRKRALMNAGLTALYVIAVGSFMYVGGTLKIGKSNSFLIPVTILLLLVMSASITGFLMFGKPVQLYIDGKKKDALSLLSQTLIFFSIITCAALVLLITFAR